ncbi:hypothetical protein [Paraburkholderia domus]|jgi:hypothetical protein|uniref:hypothetical protein n=1 Tax=Paraburkholderia domus TaxID=2793075 RepID=UPI001913D7E9|nr:hypothetical protein [Paraburkholderia domus]MBK5180380.1 hypothetical protein [Burkholderia sp. R-69749]CAE6791740.1 hypothetical protein R69749_02181 [Paraburkholderia domus]
MSRIDPAQAEAWSLIATRIKDAAFADGISDIKQLEAIFRVGEVWRKWIKRKRIARDVNRTRIINEAQQRGWLDLASIPFKDIAALPDEIIHALDQGYPEPLKSLPKPPPGGAHQTAPLIVNALLDDAVNGISSKRQQEFPEESNNTDYDRWADAVSAIRDAFALINPRRELTLGADADLLRVRLIAAYRRDGYK